MKSAFLDSAQNILEKSRKPLRVAEITSRAIKQGLIQPAGKTPINSMRSLIYRDAKKEDTMFLIAQPGVIGLKRRNYH